MTPAAPLKLARGDEAARERIRTSLHESLIVEASAGTGKTTELVRRLVRILETGTGRIQNIAAVTFTHKAAGELKLRLRQRLDETRQSATDPDSIANLEEALKHLEEATIGTIHQFCAQILRERPVEAVVDPAFEELSEPQSYRLYERAFRGWWQQRLEEPSPVLRRTLSRLAWPDAWEKRSPILRLKQAGWVLIQWRNFPAAWRGPVYDRLAGIEDLLAQARMLGGLSAAPKNPADPLYRSLAPLRDFLARLDRIPAPRDDLDQLEGPLLKLRRDLSSQFRKGSGQYASDTPREGILAARERLGTSIDAFRELADAELASDLREEMRSLVDEYDQLKRNGGMLDFDDLLILVRRLLQSNQEVRRYLQQRFTHLLVDEFQDTDPMQAAILILLTADDPLETQWLRVTPIAGKLFLVGDPKQSIYRFRRADLSLYKTVCEELSGRGVGVVKLSRSYRSVGPIQEFVNAAFGLKMGTDYSSLEEGGPGIEGQPTLIALPAPSPYSIHGNVTKKAIEDCLPGTVAGFVEWLLQASGWLVREGGELVPIRSRHVAILFRRFTPPVTRGYVRAFEARRIPHLLVGGKGFHDREEVETLRAALASIEWPDDELSVFATLRGSLFSFPDGLLLRYHHEVGRLNPFRSKRAGSPDLAQVDEALELLASLHRSRNRQPIADTINVLLEATRAHAGFAFRPAGSQVLANVYGVVTLARSYEFSDGISFRGFVEELNAQAERSDAPEAPVLEEGAEGIRIMTVHKAKGLEFPVVILADMTARLHAEPERYVDAQRGLCALSLLDCAPLELKERVKEEIAREQDEGVRMAYVAATRARDLLVVPTVGDGPYEGWLSPLSSALYPDRTSWRTGKASPGCPKFGPASVLERGGDFRDEECSVRPGLYEMGGYDITWWDPSVLRIDVPPLAGLLREDLLVAGGSEGLDRYKHWRNARQDTVAAASGPSHVIVTPTDSGVPEIAVPISVERVARSQRVPGGRRFGSLVHAILRDVDLGTSLESLERLAASHSRLLGAPDDETRAAVQTVQATLGHPLIFRARAARRLLRETPVTIPLDGNRILDGVLDLAFEDADGWTVVDFKTDADVSAKRTQYERQLQWYVLALARITGGTARGVLLSV